jgi:hypothetical protein
MSIQNNCILQVELSQGTANATEDHYITMPHAGEWKLDKAYLVVSTSVSADNTNYATVAIKQGSTTLVTEATTESDTGDLTAGTAFAMAVLASGGASLEFGAGDVVHVDVDKASSGVAVKGWITMSFKQIVS